jgi:hypothetical protein
MNGLNGVPSKKDSMGREERDSQGWQIAHSTFQRWYLEEAQDESWTSLAALAKAGMNERVK